MEAPLELQTVTGDQLKHTIKRSGIAGEGEKSRRENSFEALILRASNSTQLVQMMGILLKVFQ